MSQPPLDRERNEEQLASWLAAQDEALAEGHDVPSIDQAQKPPGCGRRLDRDLECIQVLRRFWALFNRRFE